MLDPHKPRKRDLSPESIKKYTERSRNTLSYMRKDAEDLLQDKRKKHRLALLECAPCYYRGGVAGQAFTPFECACCNTVHQHPNTSTPVFCNDCAKTNNVCIRCGASLGEAPEKDPH